VAAAAAASFPFTQTQKAIVAAFVGIAAVAFYDCSQIPVFETIRFRDY
jgi:uncharacterized membrane protein YraQ (UPF0718 family)